MSYNYIPEVNKIENKELDDEWSNIDESENHVNLVMSIRGFQKAGKTYLAMTSVKVKAKQILDFKIPDGKPLYVIDFERAASLERTHHFKEYYNDIHIKVPTVLDKLTGKVDYRKTYNNFRGLVKKLINKEEGFLVIDGFGMVGECTWYILVDEVLGIGFTEKGQPNRKVLPHEYIWRNKEHMELMTIFRNMKIPVILTNKLKPEVEQTETFFRRTGRWIEDAPKGVEYYYDAEITLNKMFDEKQNKYIRVAEIYDSRFEESSVPVLRAKIENPTMEKILEKFAEIVSK